MMAVPAPTPVTTPFVPPMVAMPADPELHVPPATASLSATVNPAHTVVAPDIVPRLGATLTVLPGLQ